MLDIPLGSIFNLFYIYGYSGEVDLNCMSSKQIGITINFSIFYPY